VLSSWTAAARASRVLGKGFAQGTHVAVLLFGSAPVRVNDSRLDHGTGDEVRLCPRHAPAEVDTGVVAAEDLAVAKSLATISWWFSRRRLPHASQHWGRFWVMLLLCRGTGW
jgi:hypothetical protein